VLGTPLFKGISLGIEAICGYQLYVTFIRNISMQLLLRTGVTYRCCVHLRTTNYFHVSEIPLKTGVPRTLSETPVVPKGLL